MERNTTAGNAAAREPQVTGLLIRQRKVADRLASAIDDLEARLQAVLRAEPPPSAEKAVGEVRTTQVPLAEEMRTIADQIDFAVQRIARMADRLEV